MDETRNLTAEANNLRLEETFSHFVGTAKDVLARYTHCALCGANLHFTHITNFATNLTDEIATCPECGIKARHVKHRLQ